MKTHSIFGPEFAEECETIRAYGGYASKTLPRHADTFKAQALRQLALSELMRERIKELEASLAAARALTDGVSAEEIAAVNGYSAEECRNLLKKIHGT